MGDVRAKVADPKHAMESACAELIVFLKERHRNFVDLVECPLLGVGDRAQVPGLLELFAAFGRINTLSQSRMNHTEHNKQGNRTLPCFSPDDHSPV